MDDMDEDFQGIEVDYELPPAINYELKTLDRFCRQDPYCILTFYGGEPLLRIDKITDIMDKVKAKLFMIQTNGLLLDRLDPAYVNRFHTVLVSIDGEEELTDYYRGKGTYRKVVDNLGLVKQNGFNGELIARMTVMEQTDIYKQVTWLLRNDEFDFTSIHWQLNAGFWQNDFKRRNFEQWVRNCYNPGIERLVDFWVDEMETTGKVLRLYPFLGIAKSVLRDERNLMRCGAGWINYAVQTDGYVIPCPTMWGMKQYYMGHIATTSPHALRRMFVKQPCIECDTLGLCGGRCLYANITKRWNLEAYGLVCNTVKFLINVIGRQEPRIREAVNRGKIKITDFDFVEYNGCEIIP